MRVRHVLCALSCLACAQVAAQVCSGGAGGGMDATGNDCNEPQSSAAADPKILAVIENRTQAIAAYESGHYPRAVSFFQIAAELGDVKSAETLSLMYRFGARLYGSEFPADRRLAEHWAAKAVEARVRTEAIKMP